MKTPCSKIFFCLFALIWLIKIDGKAQDSLKKVNMPLYLHGSFFYDFPQSFGAATGFDLPLRSKIIFTKNKAGEEKAKYRDLIIASDIGFYRYPFNNSGIYFFQSIGKRYHNEKPYYFEWLARVGVLRTFYDGIVYSVDENNNVKILKDFGRYYAITGFAVIFGHNFERSTNSKPFAIDIKPSLWIQYPYNSFILPHFSVWLTFKYHFNRFHISVKQKLVKKSIKK
ncbi:MAG TPA: hypothetical protein VFI29_02085 [Hanamia sp.]|nr:hypothetical protein [Hanamia sp.]